MRLRSCASLLALFLPAAAFGQVAGRCDTPVAERSGELGCYLVTTHELGSLSKEPVYWHLYTFRDPVAAQAQKGPRSVVTQSLGKIWLYTIAEKDWRPAAGERVAVVGPLPHDAEKTYTARYMEAVFAPGNRTAVHTHSGPEAWYVLEGAQCLETPDGITVVKAGEGAVVREGPPMMLSSVGNAMRRSVLLVLHDSSKPWSMPAMDWKPKGLCPK
jgi:quercetin dioxygenase-like cupin family protein